jgi:hypothetical protein
MKLRHQACVIVSAVLLACALLAAPVEAQFFQQGPKLVGTGAIGASSQQGWSVSVSGDGHTVIVGGPGDNNGAGGAWVYAKFAGTPGKANCYGQSVSVLARQYGGLSAAAASTGFPSISALQNAILAYCDGSDQVASSSR